MCYYFIAALLLLLKTNLLFCPEQNIKQRLINKMSNICQLHSRGGFVQLIKLLGTQENLLQWDNGKQMNMRSITTWKKYKGYKWEPTDFRRMQV